jgi:rhamnosyltransferase subunit B
MSARPTVLLATFGSLGDLHPFIALGIALRDRGVRVRLAAPVDYRAAIEAAGLEAVPMRPALESLGDPERLARRLFEPLRGSERLLREIAMPNLAAQYEDLRAASGDADLLVSHTLTYTLPVIAHELRKPWLSVVLAPIGVVSRNDPPSLPGIDLLRLARRVGPWAQRLASLLMRRTMRRWEAPLRAFRAAHGLPDDGRTIFTFEGQHSPYGTIALFDALLAAPQPDWPSRVDLCGAAVHDGALPDALVMGELQRFLDQGEPPIVFALGSAAVHIAKDFWREAIAATVDLRRRAILLTGKPIADALPEGIRAFDYLPYSSVFPHASAIVHQVGIGTLSLALRAGHPQLLLPVGMDQPDNARRAAELGVGRVLPFQRASRKSLARELAALLDDPQVAERARQTATKLRSVDGASSAAVKILERLR